MLGGGLVLDAVLKCCLEQREHLSMKSDPRLHWHFESSSHYSGLSRCVPSLSHRLPRSSRRELGLFVSSPTSSSRQLPTYRLVVIRLVATKNGGCG